MHVLNSATNYQTGNEVELKLADEGWIKNRDKLGITSRQRSNDRHGGQLTGSKKQRKEESVGREGHHWRMDGSRSGGETEERGARRAMDGETEPGRGGNGRLRLLHASIPPLACERIKTSFQPRVVALTDSS